MAELTAVVRWAARAAVMAVLVPIYWLINAWQRDSVWEPFIEEDQQ